MSPRPAFREHGAGGSVIMMAMSDNTTPDAVSVPADEPTPARPLQLGGPEILAHILPKAVPGAGVAQLDVAAFCSSI